MPGGFMSTLAFRSKSVCKSRLNSTCKSLLQYLVNLAGKKQEVTISHSQMVQDTGISLSSLKRSLCTLTKESWLEVRYNTVQYHTEKYGKGASTYKFITDTFQKVQYPVVTGSTSTPLSPPGTYPQPTGNPPSVQGGLSNTKTLITKTIEHINLKTKPAVPANIGDIPSMNLEEALEKGKSKGKTHLQKTPPALSTLVGVWKDMVPLLFPQKTILPPLTKKDYAQLKIYMDKAGSAYLDAFYCILENWSDFSLMVCEQNGHKGLVSVPNIGYIASHGAVAANFYLMKSAPKKVHSSSPKITAHIIQEPVKVELNVSDEDQVTLEDILALG